MTARRSLLLAALVAALQIGFLGWIIAGRAAVLRDGREVLLKVEPVDPRDLLRGDYVRLGYEISQIPGELVKNISDRSDRGGKMPIFVRIEPGTDGVWKLKAASLGDPLEPPPTADEVDIRGQVESWNVSETAGSFIRPSFGVERFYLPEGEGRQIETDMRERPFFVKVAVAADGTAQIKQFLDGDKVLYSEPLY
ncbi:MULTISPECIES: GDYXXLXY domain-containing protein [Mesorhizobium]|uniref:GDYXXLXY domain-containing protein n=1 Tax=Mesorhizobium denitrificans TaxID=2294114 RepID=A0A371XDN3_9HYPH|nr:MULTISPECIES: GDYXXLXY domain-containing protein [Mesorhizobium]RFC67340.1 hypothetical protein DY251_12405 [Mesorhizobium denitrificans]